MNIKKSPAKSGTKYFQSNLTKFETSSTVLDFISKVNHFNGRVFRISTGFFRDSIGLVFFLGTGLELWTVFQDTIYIRNFYVFENKVLSFGCWMVFPDTLDFKTSLKTYY